MAGTIILWDADSRNNLLPFTFTRPVGDIRVGILTIAEKYQKYLGCSVSFLTSDYLSAKFPVDIEPVNIFIRANVLPDAALIDALRNLKQGDILMDGNVFIAGILSEDEVGEIKAKGKVTSDNINQYTGARYLNHTWDIFSYNSDEIQHDFDLITEGRKTNRINSSNFVKRPENIFIEAGAIVDNASLNASEGPIYIGRDAEIMEGSLIRGPFSLGEHSTVKMGAKI